MIDTDVLILRMKWRDRAQLAYRDGKSRHEWDNSSLDSHGVSLLVSPHPSWDFLPRYSRRTGLSHSIHRISTRASPHSPGFLTIPENSDTTLIRIVEWDKRAKWSSSCQMLLHRLYRVELFSYRCATKSFSHVHGKFVFRMKWNEAALHHITSDITAQYSNEMRLVITSKLIWSKFSHQIHRSNLTLDYISNNYDCE